MRLPETFMNLSGKSVAGVMNVTRAKPEDLMIVADDVHLRVGHLRIRRAGSSGGHNGLAHIIQCLGTDQWPRLRIGVGQPPPRADQADYVLARPGSEDARLLDTAISDAADAAEMWIGEGIDRCMSAFNGKGRSTS